MLSEKLTLTRLVRVFFNSSIHHNDNGQQLEQTVTKLQIAVGYTTEQVSALPPPLLKIRELEQDNARLQKENDELRRLLQPDSRTDASRRTAVATYQDPRTCDRDYNLKRRKPQDGVYIVCSSV